MNSKESEQMALLKFSVIAPLVNQTYGEASKSAYFRKMAAESYQLPDGRVIQYSPNTIKHWFQDYTNGGLDALRKRPRRDVGQSRVLSPAQKARIDELRRDFPLLSATMVYRRMIEEGHLLRQEVSLSTVQRYFRTRRNTREHSEGDIPQRLAFEMEFANDCWQADTCYLPAITVNGTKQKTYLISVLDDASRMSMHAEIFFADNAVNFQHCLRKAITKYGVPKRLYVDNGSPYKNEQLRLICAGLGIILIHSRVRQPQGKGKQERVFRTIQQGWVYGQDFGRFTSLEQLNEEFQTWLQQDYTNRIHSSLDSTPRERFLKDQSRLRRLPPEKIEQNFLHRIERRVAADSTIQIDKHVFEVHHRLIGQKIKVRYLPSDLSVAYVFDADGQCEGQIHLVRKIDNARIKRQTTIDYTQAGGVQHV